MYGYGYILCGISKRTFEIPHNMSYSCTERYNFNKMWKFEELLNSKSCMYFLKCPPDTPIWESIWLLHLCSWRSFMLLALQDHDPPQLGEPRGSPWVVWLHFGQRMTMDLKVSVPVHSGWQWKVSVPVHSSGLYGSRQQCVMILLLFHIQYNTWFKDLHNTILIFHETQ